MQYKFVNVIKNNRNMLLNLGIIMIILGIISPILIASAFTFYRGDDFAQGLISVKTDNIASLLVEAVYAVKTEFFNWKGTYFTSFINVLTHPLNGNGNLRINMIVNTCLFVSSICYFIWQLCKKEITFFKSRLLLVLCVLIGILGFESWHQIFFWYTGAVAYTIPFSLMFIGGGGINC